MTQGESTAGRDVTGLPEPRVPYEDRGAVSVTRTLDLAEGVLAWHGRTLARSGSTVVLDHLLASRAGGFLLQEPDWPGSVSVQDGKLIRHRMGPGGQWARGAEDAELDQIRRTAETVETIVGRPIEPVLVLTGTATSFTAPVSVRGVLVMSATQLPEWLAALPDQVDRAEMALTSARMERAFRSATAKRRIPGWQDYNAPRSVGRQARGPVPIRPAPGPRDYSLPTVFEPARTDCRGSSSRPHGRARSLFTALAVSAAISSGLWWINHHGWLQAPSPFSGERSVGAPQASAPAPAGQPSAPRTPIRIDSCGRLAAERVTAVVGRPVFREPVASATVCEYGTAPATPESTVVSVVTGPGALTAATTHSAAMWSLTYHAGSPAPDGTGRLLAGPLRISLRPDLFAGDSTRGKSLAEAVSREVVAANS